MTSLLTATHVPQRWLYGVLIAARMINVRAVYAQSACQQQVRVASIVGNLWVRAMQSGLDLGIRRSVVRFVDIRFAVAQSFALLYCNTSGIVMYGGASIFKVA